MEHDQRDAHTPDVTEAEEPKALLECLLKYILHDKDGAPLEDREASGVLFSEELHIISENGHTFIYPLLECTALAAGDYRIRLEFVSGTSVVLYFLGYRYEDFLKKLAACRNACLIKALLMEEKKIEVFGQSEVAKISGGEAIGFGECSLALYETALIVVPLYGQIMRIPYGFIETIEKKDYALTVRDEVEGDYVITKMGYDLDPFEKKLHEVIGDLTQKTFALLSASVDAPPGALRSAAVLMRDGRAVPKSQLDSAAPRLWPKLEAIASAGANAQEYAYLKSICDEDLAAIGIKSGLMGELDGRYTWFIMPVLSGNAIAMEVASGKSAATYFFKIAPRADFARGIDAAEMKTLAQQMIQQMTYCMVMINFRREPIYMSESSFGSTKYVKYAYALKNVPSLRRLRACYIGRVAHAGFEQWQDNVSALLSFNTAADDNAVWAKC